MLKADELLIISGDAVRVLFPPALLSRVSGERKEQLATRNPPTS